MTILQVILLSIIEGLTEFLPVSSTGHLILASRMLGIAQTAVHGSFEIAIQLGAILAVIVLYGRRLLTHRRTMLLTAVAFVPTAIIGALLHGFLKDVLLGNVPVVLWSLGAGGAVLVLFDYGRFDERARAHALEQMTVRQAAIVGLCQALSIVPGVSRAAATIVAGQLLGVGRAAIVEFSFVLAIPTMAAATGYDLWMTAGEFSGADVRMLLIGMVVSFVVAMAAIRWFIAYVQRHQFAVFGWYRMLLAVLFFILWT